jgi:ABC-2 type transport system ATP-binding protein
VIRFEKLNKSFRRTHVLKGLDLEIDRGDRIALVGSNGAGKTTMIRCLLGEYTHEGVVTVNGLDPREHRCDVLGRIGFVPQLPPPLKLGVSHLIDFSARLCGSDPARMIEIAGRLGLDIGEMKNRPFVKLSGGEKQKLLIGIALGRDTDLLVMDEPAANLDPVARQVLFGLLAERREDVSMIISSHRLDEVAALVNRVVELDRGRIVLDDHVDDQVDMAGVLDCTINLTGPNPAFAEAVTAWDFVVAEDGRNWSGRVAGPDRLRFLGMLSRYAGLLRGIEMKEAGRENES